MCTNNNPLYLNNIFDETHPELIDLHENLQEFQNDFMETSSEDIETENIIETNVIEDFDDDFDDEINNEVFSEIEIKKFEKIYNNEPIEESEISELEAEKEKLNRKNEEAKNYIINILKKKCYQQNMFLLGIISTSTRNSITSTSDYMTMAFVFDGIAICNNAFLKLYNLSYDRLTALKNHYKNNDIVPKVHLNKGRNVSHKLSFETVLKVLTFLKSYANLNGLPSP
ncbi:17162_t:CDS:2, partial [Entrophospora sp. SA101]